MAFILSREAEGDFARIYEYSLREFGFLQADRYMSGLIDAFDMLALNPMSGKEQKSSQEGLRCLLRGSHAAYYLIAENDVVIVRILHQSQDPLRHL